MPNLNALPEIAIGDITDDDLILMYDVGAATDHSKKATRANFLKDVARIGGNHNFGIVEVTRLTTNEAIIVGLSVTTSLEFGSAATLQKIYAATGSITIPALTAGSAATMTIAAAGVLTTDQAQASFTSALTDGLTYQCWVSASNVVSIRVFNGTTGTIATASPTVIVSIQRFDFS